MGADQKGGILPFPRTLNTQPTRPNPNQPRHPKWSRQYGTNPSEPD